MPLSSKTLCPCPRYKIIHKIHKHDGRVLHTVLMNLIWKCSCGLYWDYFSSFGRGTGIKSVLSFPTRGLPDQISVQPAGRGQHLVQRRPVAAGGERVQRRPECLTLRHSKRCPHPCGFAGEPICQPGGCLPQYGEKRFGCVWVIIPLQQFVSVWLVKI